MLILMRSRSQLGSEPLRATGPLMNMFRDVDLVAVWVVLVITFMYSFGLISYILLNVMGNHDII